jgi:hypothetical protein
MAANWTAFVAGNVLEASQLNGVVDNFADTAIFNETQASGTNGGTFTGGSFLKRTLNTTVVNNITGCSIASSVITLPAGTYSVFAAAPAYQVDSNKLRLQNTTDATTELSGTNERTGSATDAQVKSFVQGVFTIAATKDFELQHRCATTKSNTGFGSAAAFSGVTEMWSTIQITRIA